MYELDSRALVTVLGNEVMMYYRKETNDTIIIDGVMIGDEYKSKEITLRNNDIFIDLGAHIGTWTVLMAMNNKSFKVLSYEPIPENFEILERNIKQNHLLNVQAFNQSVSSENGTETIYYTNDGTPFGAQHKFVGCMFGDSSDAIQVPRTSLNDILNSIPKCRILKADCEGCIEKSIAFVTSENLKKIDYLIGEYHSVNGLSVSGFYKFLEPYFIDQSGRVARAGDLDRFFYVNRLLEHNTY